MGERLGHQALAGAIGGSAVVCGAVAGPLWATVFDLASALATAGVAASAVRETARERGVPTGSALAKAVREVTREPDAPLAAHAVDVLRRVHAGDSRVLRSVAMLVGRATTAHAPGLALQLFGSWCAPLRKLTALGAPVAAARAAMDSAELVRAMTETVAFLDLVAAPAVSRTLTPQPPLPPGERGSTVVSPPLSPRGRRAGGEGSWGDVQAEDWEEAA